MLLFWLTILGAAACVFLGIRIGFYVVFQSLFNTLVSIYVGIMVTPRLIGLIPEISSSQYSYSVCISAIAVILFIIMQAVTLCFFTGDSELSFPKLFDSVGAGILGFILGYVVLNFLIMLLYTMPFTNTSTLREMVFIRDPDHKPHALVATAKACNFVGAISLQCHQGEVEQVIDWLVKSEASDTDRDNSDSGISEDARKRRESWKNGPEVTPK